MNSRRGSPTTGLDNTGDLFILIDWDDFGY